MISVDFSYAYIAFILFFGFVWLSVFLARPDLRKEILFMSFVCAPLGILGDFFYRYDYYNLPNLNGTYWYLYSFALGFIYGGVTAVLYEELVRKHHTTRRIRRMLEHPWCFWGVLLSGSFATDHSISNVVRSVTATSPLVTIITAFSFRVVTNATSLP